MGEVVRRDPTDPEGRGGLSGWLRGAENGGARGKDPTMGNTFSADTGGIAKNSPYMQELGARLLAVHDWLNATHEELLPYAGDDRTGEQFRAQYEPSAQRILETIRSAKQLFDSTSDGITTMAKGLEQMEGTHVEAARRLAPEQVEPRSTGTGKHG
ncbi:hypothetical protein [Actinacidiphila guanduensis]|uniref:hypothetical protein n=1 Tax=Actinacidiphila guanduensis TaxID=310781 RepID=UPI00115FE270|nr:hypothetical protein [Actinacidiphila guanduensis]